MAMFLAIAALAAPALSFNPSVVGIPSPFHDIPCPWEDDDHGSHAGTTPSPSGGNSPSSTTAAFALKPTAGATWNIQLENVPSPAQADDDAYHIWDFDMEDAPQSTIDAFHAKGHQVVCYFSAGSWEDYRSDADQFPKEALGKVLDGWPHEKWVDTRNAGVRAVMKKRIQIAKEKGCDGIDADNVDGYSNDTGFDLTEDDGVDFVQFLVKTAHDQGMAYGLKNAGDILDRVVDVVQFSVQEECVYYDECDTYQPFIKQDKPVFNIEYPDDKPKTSLSKFIEESCSDPDANGFSQLIKKRDLGEWTRTCS